MTGGKGGIEEILQCFNINSITYIHLNGSIVICYGVNTSTNIAYTMHMKLTYKCRKMSQSY